MFETADLVDKSIDVVMVCDIKFTFADKTFNLYQVVTQNVSQVATTDFSQVAA